VEPPREWDEYSRRVAAGLQAADVVTAPTQAMLTMLEDEYGSLRRTAVVPNGRSAIAATIRSPQKEPLIFSAGRIWDPAKNVHTLCLAAPLVSWPVSVAGDTSSPDGKPVACQDVDVLGPLPPAAVQDWLARASIYALPARYEPFGLSILEAAASGCALVVGDIASLREIWGDAATYVAPDDTRAVADALQSLIDDPPRRSALAAHAREVAATFSAQRMGEGYGTIYSNLTGRRREVA
jgi:glycosyltransferase involved in cell wall biosynthesis